MRGMNLVEIKAEITPKSAEAVDNALLESGAAEWSVYHDVVAKQAWIVGAFVGERDALMRWAALLPLLAADSLFWRLLYRQYLVFQWQPSP